jgi:outer membrane autotransporter protein
MTKNRFLSKRLACLLTTALIAAPIFLINNKPAYAGAVNQVANTTPKTVYDAADDVTFTAATAQTTLAAATGTATSFITTATQATAWAITAGNLTVTGAVGTAATGPLTITLSGTGDLTLGAAVTEANATTAEVIINLGGRTLTTSAATTAGIAAKIAGAGNLAVTAGTKTFADTIGVTGTPITNLTVATGATATHNAAVFTTNFTQAGTATYTTLTLDGTAATSGKTNATTGIVQRLTSDLNINFATTDAATTNVVANHTGAAGTSLVVGKAVTNGQIVFATTNQTAATILGKIYMPANLVNGQTLILHNDLLEADLVTGVAATNLALQDNALTNYTAAAATEVNVVTSTDKTASVTAAELGVNTNKASGLLQARNAAAAANTAGTDTAAIDAIFNVLNGRSGQSATADTEFTNQVAPQTDTITGSTVAAKAVTSGVQNVISTRLASLRSGDAYSTGVVTGSGMSANSGFIQAFGSTVEQKNKGNEFGYDADTTGFAVGFDGKIDGGAVIGISYAHSQADVDGKGTAKAKNDIKTDSVSLYADYATKDGYVEGSITYGRSDNKGSRVIDTGGLSRTYASNYDSEQYSLRLSGGIPQSLGGGAFFTPFAAATISQIKADAYTETSTTANDSLRLRVAQDTVDSQVGTVGVKFHQTIKDGKTTFTPEVKLAVNQEFGDDNITTTNTYQGGGASFKNSTAIEKTSATAGVGLNISSDNVSFNIGYEADVRDKYLGHSAQAKITAKF